MTCHFYSKNLAQGVISNSVILVVLNSDSWTLLDKSLHKTYLCCVAIGSLYPVLLELMEKWRDIGPISCGKMFALLLLNKM